MRAEATDADGGDHEAVTDDLVIIVETVSYTGLTTGKEYTLTDTLVDKEASESVRLDGKIVSSIMAFESVVLDGQEVALLANLNDERQDVELVLSEVPQTPTLGGKLS